MHDLRLALRALCAAPIVTAVAVVSLALGIGVNTAIFSLVNSVMLRPLPVAAPDRLFILSSEGSHGLQWAWNYSVWEQIRARPELFDGVAAWGRSRFNLAQGGETHFVDGLFANGSFFSTLGVPAALGRTFTDADDVRGGGPVGAVAVISHGFWQRRFGGADSAVGSPLTLDGAPFTIIGITPPDFFGPEVGRTFDVVVPFGDEPILHGRETWLDQRGWYWLTMLARLRPDQTQRAAAAALRSVQRAVWDATVPRSMRPEYREKYLSESFTLLAAPSGDSTLRRSYGRPLATLLVIVTLVSLIACVNIANLQLARGAARRHELGLQRALGATRGRLVRQLLLESAMLCVVGTAAGAVASMWGSRLLVNQLSTEANRIFLDLSIDIRVLAFTFGAAAATTLLSGIAPALATSGVAPIEAVKQQGRGSPDRRPARLMSGLLSAQIAVSIVLMVAAGLFVRTFVSLTTRSAGFDRDRVLLVDLDTGGSAVPPARRVSVFNDVTAAVQALPGISGAAVSMTTPIGGQGFVGRVEVSGGAALPDDGLGGNAFANVVSPGWFSTFGTPILAGRDFRDEDRQESPRVAIVNETLARASLGRASPIGRRITLITPGRAVDMEIVGVVADAVYSTLRETVPPTIFYPMAQFYMSPALLASVTLSVRCDAPPLSMTKSIADAIGRINPELALTFRPLAVQVKASLVQERVTAMLAGFLGLLAVLLAALGLYGTTSYAVTRRRAEIGIRMALGAAPGDIVRLVFARVAFVVSVGVLVGTASSLWASKFVAALLYSVYPRDTATLAGAVVLLTAISGVAALLPARRASTTDPAEILRAI
jgi:putative ABC transport system permease protein